MKKIIKISLAFFGVVFLVGCGKQSANQTQLVAPTSIIQPSIQADNASSSIDGIKIEKIDRKKGEKCATSGPEERYNDLPLANESYPYTDPFKSITLEMPYNKNWKFTGCEIGPFDQFKDGDGVFIYFGQPSSWGPDQYSLRIGKVRSIDDIQKELLADSTLARSQMKKITINGLNAFRWQEYGMGEIVKIEVVEKNIIIGLSQK